LDNLENRRGSRYEKENEQEEATGDKLIAIEWDVLNDLKKMLSNQTTQNEKIRLSNAVAYHAIVIIFYVGKL